MVGKGPEQFGIFLALPLAAGFLSGNGSCKELVIPTGQLKLRGKVCVPYALRHRANHKNRAASSLCPVSSHWFGRREGSSFIFNPRSWKNKSPGGERRGFHFVVCVSLKGKDLKVFQRRKNLASFLLYQLPRAFCLVMEAVRSLLYRQAN
jgi:hypothetical protein